MGREAYIRHTANPHVHRKQISFLWERLPIYSPSQSSFSLLEARSDPQLLIAKEEVSFESGLDLAVSLTNALQGWRGGFLLSAAEQYLKLELTKNFKVWQLPRVR